MDRRSFYIAVILSELSSTAEDYEPLCEESFVLISAASQAEALDKAKEHARARKDEYENVLGDPVSWSPTLVELGDSLVDSFEDGSEFYARFFRNRRAYDQLGFESFVKSETKLRE